MELSDIFKQHRYNNKPNLF